MLLEQLVTKLNVLGLGVLLAQASVDLLLPFVVLGLALCRISFRPVSTFVNEALGIATLGFLGRCHGGIGLGSNAKEGLNVQRG